MASTKLELQAVLFDLDGTLVDSLSDIIASVRATEVELGFVPVADDDIRNWIGNGAEVLVRRLLARDMHAEPDAKQLFHVFPIFMRHYKQQGGNASRLYPGARQLLQSLHQHGVKVGLVTNKPREITLALLKKLAVYEHFQAIVAGGDVGQPKPHPMALLEAARQLGVAPEHCVMVGDSRNDVQSGHNAGMRVAGIRGGYNHGEPLEAAKPDWLFDSLAELLKVAERLQR